MRTQSIFIPLLTSMILSAAVSTTRAASPLRPDAKVEIVAADMCCAGCAQKVSAQLYAARGVKSVEANLVTRIVTITLPEPSTRTLGQLWHAVEQGEGGPAKLMISTATYTLTPPVETTAAQHARADCPINIAIDNLHCKGCAQQIAAQLYTLKGVTNVGADLEANSIRVQTRPGTNLSPWLVIEAVTNAKERPLSVTGAYGTLAIDWVTDSSPKNHQAQNPKPGGIIQ